MRRSIHRRRLSGLRGPVRLAALLLLLGLWYASSPADASHGAVGDGSSASVLLGAEPSAASSATSGAAAPQATDAAHTQDEGHDIDVPKFFLILISILIFAKLFGELAERIGQPAVLGELVAGVMLGGSFLGIVPTDGQMGIVIHLLARLQIRRRQSVVTDYTHRRTSR